MVSVGPAYFETVGVPMVSGRAFRAEDAGQGRCVIVINETMARTFWPGGNAIGGRVHSEGPSASP